MNLDELALKLTYHALWILNDQAFYKYWTSVGLNSSIKRNQTNLQFQKSNLTFEAKNNAPPWRLYILCL